MAKHIGFMRCFIVVVSLLFAASSSEAATRYSVGDDFGWNLPPNQTFYSDWASSKNFIVGDSLVFNWTGNQNVADVPRVDYNNCSTDVVTFTGGPNRTVFRITLLYPGRRYFMCTVDDHCQRGQKFSINVKWPFSSPSAQPPSSSPAPTPSYMP